jgi:mono/diheme cytochrome c family protein
MAVSFTTIGFAGVIVTGLTLTLIGRQEAPPALPVATPGAAAKAFAASLAVPPASVAAAPQVGAGALTSVSFNLPTSDRSFPPGPGAAVVAANCVTCHSAGMVLNQPALTRATWDAEVHKMIGVYKAPVTEADAATIIGYLAQLKPGP